MQCKKRTKPDTDMLNEVQTYQHQTKWLLPCKCRYKRKKLQSGVRKRDKKLLMAPYVQEPATIYYIPNEWPPVTMRDRTGPAIRPTLSKEPGRLKKERYPYHGWILLNKQNWKQDRGHQWVPSINPKNTVIGT